MNWGVFWSILLVLFIFLPLLMIWIFAIVDLFGRMDIGGLAKVLWLLAIVFIPILGTVGYFIFRPLMPESRNSWLEEGSSVTPPPPAAGSGE